jgi:major membrane immunogen (membrane-anchored lipoprotein)
MKNVLKFLPFFLMLSLLVISCGKDDEKEDPDDDCVTDPAITIEENIIGTWIIDGEVEETVTFNTDGTGTSSEAAFHFSATNEGKNYNKFGWEIESDTIVKVTYDYSPDVPVVPYIISENYTVVLNNCDRIEMESAFGSMFPLTR